MTKPESGTRFLKVPIINGPRDLLSVKIQDIGFKSFADNKQLLGELFVISGIIKVEVSVISRAEG